MSTRAPSGPDPEQPAMLEPEELEPLETPAVEGDAPTPPSRRSRSFTVVAIALAAAFAVAALLGYRAWQERRIVAISLERARHLIRSDTWLGYREAAALLELRAARVDPLGAGSLRALALALLAADYRDEVAAREAQQLLVSPGRAEVVPVAANLAMAALGLARGEVGNAVVYASRAGDVPLAHLIRARAAVVAGNGEEAAAAVDRALALDGSLPASQALHGDLLRRAGQLDAASAAYGDALAASARELELGLARERGHGAAPHARATLGLAKVALSRRASPGVAEAALSRLVDDRAATPGVERARAALHLSALLARAEDRAGAASALDRAGLDPPARAWIERAAALEEVERGSYRVVEQTPRALVSASDDDPYVAPPPPPSASRAEPPPPPKYPPGFKIHGAAKHGGAKHTPPKKKKRHADPQRPASRSF